MAQRLELHELLVGILGSSNVYFQSPNNLVMQYPCIVYARDSAKTEFANNDPYTISKRYMVTIIDKNPDSLIPDKIAQLRTSTFARRFEADNLHHDIYNIYF